MEENIAHIVEKYLKDTISDTDRRFLQQWASEEKNRNALFDIMIAYYARQDFNKTDAFRRLESEILNTERKISPRKKRLPLLKYAAVISGLALAGFLLYNRSAEPVEKVSQTEVTLEIEGAGTQTVLSDAIEKITDTDGTVIADHKRNTLEYSNGNTGNPAKIVHSTLRVPYGKTFQVLLSDKSRVHLNAGSSLRYPNRFDAGRPREVSLEGEGYFEVSEDSDSPFIVHTGEISTKVFGTEFNISSYPDDPSTQVVLVTGSVGVFGVQEETDDRLPLMLQPNQMAVKEPERDIEIQEINVASRIAWIKGTLFFKNEEFTSIKRKLERHYDITIIDKNPSLEDKKFTGQFDIETIDQIFATFQKTNDFEYTITDKRVTIYPDINSN